MDVVSRLDSVGVLITTKPGAAQVVTFHMLRSQSDARSLRAPPTTGKAPILRSAMREMQDKSHTRDDGLLAHLGTIGYLEIAVLALYVSTHAGKDDLTATFACQTIGNLAMITSNRARLAELGAIEAVVYVMNEYRDNMRVQKDGVVALRHLAYEHDDNKLRIIHMGGIHVTIAAMNTCVDGALALQVHKQCCSALTIFAMHNTQGDIAKQEIVQTGAIHAILRAMRIHTTDLQLLVTGLKAVSALASCPDARIHARDSGCFDLFDYLAGMDACKYAREFHDAARHAVRRLRA
jgi:hypothetical protein